MENIMTERWRTSKVRWKTELKVYPISQMLVNLRNVNYVKISNYVQLPHVLNELSSVRLIVDSLSKEHNYMQSESTSDTTINKQWTQVSYNHQKIPNNQKRLKTTDRILSQHIPGTANRFEILINLSTDIVNHKSENKSVKETSESTSFRQRKSTYKENGSLRSQVHRKDSPFKIPTLVNGLTSNEASTKNTRHKLKSNTQSLIDHKIIILGDTHARSLSSNVKNDLDDN
jgi:hypothetical protein